MPWYTSTEPTTHQFSCRRVFPSWVRSVSPERPRSCPSPSWPSPHRTWNGRSTSLTWPVNRNTIASEICLSSHGGPLNPQRVRFLTLESYWLHWVCPRHKTCWWSCKCWTKTNPRTFQGVCLKFNQIQGLSFQALENESTFLNNFQSFSRMWEPSKGQSIRLCWKFEDEPPFFKAFQG